MRLSPARQQLLRKLERIVGNSCYNGNIKNFGPGGYEEPEGRWFRYPVRFPDDARRYGSLPADLSDEKLLSGYYAFGANRLSILTALNKVISLLEAEYGLELEEPPSK